MREPPTTDRTPEAPLSDLHARPEMLPYLADAWRLRRFPLRLALYNHQARFSRERLGRAWFILSDLLPLLVYTLVFGLLLGRRRPEGFFAYLAVGRLMFGFLAGAATRAGTVLHQRQPLISTLYFPRVLLPASMVAGTLLEFRYRAAIALVSGMVVAGAAVSGWALLTAVLLPLATIFALGYALLIAAVASYASDFTKVMPAVNRALFYVSGVLMPLDALLDGRAVQRMLPLNPFYAFIETSRGLVGLSATPSLELWISVILWSISMGLIGVRVFVIREHAYVQT